MRHRPGQFIIITALAFILLLSVTSAYAQSVPTEPVIADSTSTVAADTATTTGTCGCKSTFQRTKPH